MRNSNAGKLAILTTLAASLLFSGSLSAESYKKISRTIDAALLGSLEIEASAAEMEIEIYAGDEIELEIELESDRNWFAWRRGDIDNVELEVRMSETSIYLGISDQNVEQHWRLKIPAKLAISMDVGVGEIELEGLSNNLKMEVGVGSIRVDVDDTDYARIHASVGVGETTIKGFSAQQVDNERSFMSSDSYYHGDGELEIDIEIGVGEVEVRSR